MGLSAIFCKTSALQVDEVLDKGGSSQLLLPETSLDPFTHVVPGHSWHRGLLGGSTFWLFWDGYRFGYIVMKYRYFIRKGFLFFENASPGDEQILS